MSKEDSAAKRSKSRETLLVQPRLYAGCTALSTGSQSAIPANIHLSRDSGSAYTLPPAPAKIHIDGGWFSISAMLLSAVGKYGSRSFVNRVQLPVLLYHHVGPLRPGSFPTLTVSPHKFRSQVEWLSRKGYQAITDKDWLLAWIEGKSLPAKPVLLTFDDGYKDLAEFAFPILKQHGFGATAFIVTSQIGGTNAWDQNSGSAAHDLLNAEDILYWSRNGIEFGSHSVTHPDMTALSTQALDAEARESGRELSAVLGHEVLSFAYPYGRMNAVVREAVSNNYRLAFTTEAGMNHLDSDLFSLKRTMVQSSDSLIDLRLRVIFGWNPIQEARRRIAQLRGRAPKDS